MDAVKTFVNSFGMYLPLLGAVIFATPSYFGVIKQRKVLGFAILVLLSVLAIAVPTLAIKAGIFSDSFAFSNALGPKFLDTTPIAVGFMYPPLLLITFWFASKFTRGFGRVVIGSVLTLLLHFVLDPATVKLELWQQEASGIFYGVPLINFIAWFVVGVLGMVILHILWGKEQRVKAAVAYSGFALLLFWTGVNAGVTQKIPLGIGAVYALIVLVVIILEKQQFKEEH